MDWITDSIAIGNFLDARNLAEEIQRVLCLKPDCDCESRDSVVVHHAPLIDGAGNNAIRVAHALRFLETEIEVGMKVLVHCHAGRSRSVVIVARHLMAVEGISQAAALSRIVEKREIYLSDGIDELFNL